MICSFVIQGEPVPCARARVVQTSRGIIARTPEKTRNYERLVSLSARAARPAGWRLDWASYDLHIGIFRAIRKGDGDNYQKAIADGCTGVLWTNDSAVRRWVVVIADDLDHPRVTVTAAMDGTMDLEADRKARTLALAAHKTRVRR